MLNRAIRTNEPSGEKSDFVGSSEETAHEVDSVGSAPDGPMWRLFHKNKLHILEEHERIGTTPSVLDGPLQPPVCCFDAGEMTAECRTGPGRSEERRVGKECR